MDHECCRWIDQVDGQQSYWKLKRFSSWLKMQSVSQEPKLENKMTQERMTRRIRQLEEEKLFADMQASKELDKRRKTPEQKVASSITVWEELSLKEQVRKLTEQVPLLMASSQERGAASSAEELSGMTETCGESTMSILSSDEMSWKEKQVTHRTAGSAWDHLSERPRLVLAEIGAHTGARMCSTMQELAGTKNATKLGGTDSHLTDPTRRRLLAKTLEQERTRHLWHSPRRGSYCTPARTVNNAQQQTQRD